MAKEMLRLEACYATQNVEPLHGPSQAGTLQKSDAEHCVRVGMFLYDGALVRLRLTSCSGRGAPGETGKFGAQPSHLRDLLLGGREVSLELFLKLGIRALEELDLLVVLLLLERATFAYCHKENRVNHVNTNAGTQTAVEYTI